MRSYKTRKRVNHIASLLALGCVLVALIPLVSILVEVIAKGAPAIDWEFLTERTKSAGSADSGIGNAILGTLLLVAWGSVIGLPLGILTGVYVSEYGDNWFGRTVRFFNDVLANFPSIVIGLFAYSLIVTVVGFSLISGAFALAIIMIPIVANTTEEALRMVPNSLREASLALGVPRWKTVLKIIISNGRAGLVTGALLAIARIAGETAPLILTSFGNSFWETGLTEPVAALPLVIFRNAMSPYADLQQQAWGAALVLITMVLSLNVIVRLLTRKRFKKNKVVKASWKQRLSLSS
ncbi:TPA: phosphate ABC transporter permease PstA [Thermoplasmata archaeon]|nr:phosphate ABC transporter permease PstA [Thermoplasmata archaeon]